MLYEINGRLADMNQRVADQALQVRQALEKARMTEQRYAADVPRGSARELYDLMQARMADGLSAARLRFLIGSAQLKDLRKPGHATSWYARRSHPVHARRPVSARTDHRHRAGGIGQKRRRSPASLVRSKKPVRLTFTAVGQPSERAWASCRSAIAWCWASGNFVF